MPSVSRKQRNFMAAAAHDPKFAKKAGVSQGVAREFNQADKGRKFAEGGEVDPRRSIVREPGKPPRNYDPYEDLRKQYQTPGTVIRGDELPNSKPTSRPNMENSKVKRTYKDGGKVDDSIEFTGEELAKMDDKVRRIRKEGAAAGFSFVPEGARAGAAEAYEGQRKKGKAVSTAIDAANVMKEHYGKSKFAAGGKIKKGGFMKHDDAAEDKKLIRKEFKRMEGAEHKAANSAVAKLAKGGSVKRYAGGGKVARGMGAALRGGKYC